MLQTEEFVQERRYHPRVQMQVAIRGLRLDPGGDIVDTFHMTDISRNGMGAIVDKPYYRGQRVVLSLPGHQIGVRRNVYATVVRCRIDNDGYRIGLKFDNAFTGLCSAPEAHVPARKSGHAAA